MNGKHKPSPHIHLEQDDIDRIASAVSHTLRESIWSERGIASQKDLNLMEKHIMATVQQLKDAVAAEASEVKAKLDALEAEVQALKDQIAAGGTVTEAQLDEVLAGIQGIFTPTVPVPPVS